MRNLKWLLFIACVALILVTGSTAWGEKIIERKAIEKQDIPMMIEFVAVKSPWPVPRGTAARTGRTGFKGPGSNLMETASIDLYNGVLSYRDVVSSNPMFGKTYKTYTLKREDINEEFRRLLVGADNRLYFNLRSNYFPRGNLYSFDMSSGMQWYIHKSSQRIALDPINRIYRTVAYTLVDNKPVIPHLQCLSPAGGQLWKEDFTDVKFTSVITAGKRIYVRGPSEGNEYLIRAYAQNGDHVWTSASYPDIPFKLAEDADGNVYFIDKNSVMHKINADGSTAWDFQPPPKSNSKKYYTDLEQGPICGSDGHVWGAVHYIPGNLRIPGLPYAVINSDGSTYKNGFLGKDKVPVAACYGGNSRFYLLFKDGTLNCYEDWDEEIWSIQIGGISKALDVVMDVDDTIYLLYSAWGIQTLGQGCYISVLDPSDGEILKTKLVDVPEDVCRSKSELAIGEDEKLFYLNADGYVIEFSSLRIKPGAFKKIQGG